MGVFPASPRARRRMLGVAALATPLVAIVTVVVVLGGHGPPNPKPVRNEGNAIVAAPTVRLTAQDRRAIDATLDVFVPDAIGRKAPAKAWPLAGPELRSSSTLATWRTGSLPVPAYPVGDTTFHSWSTIDSGAGYVDFNLLVHPRHGSSLGAYVFAGEMVKNKGRWLVNRMYTAAIMNPVRGSTHEVGPADFSAQAAASSSGPPHGKAVLGGFGIAPMVAIFGLVLLIPLAVAIGAFVRGRRWHRRNKATGRTALPPLPPMPDSHHRERETAGRT